jgi:hypothetical protein
MRRADRSVVMTATVVMGSYRPLPEPPMFVSRAAKVAKTLKLRTLAKLYVYETLLEGLAQDFQDVAAKLRELIEKHDTMVRQRHLAWHGHLAPPISPTSAMVWCGARNGRVMTQAVRSPVRPATRWMRVVSSASARVIAGRMVVSRRASLDLPAPRGPSSKRFGAQRLHDISLHQCLSSADGPTAEPAR